MTSGDGAITANKTCGDISDTQNITSALTVHLVSANSGLAVSVYFYHSINKNYKLMVITG